MSRPIQPHTSQSKSPGEGKIASSPTSSSPFAQEPGNALENMLQQFRVHKRSPMSMASASVSSAFESITGNRTRSLLTMLGIFIGVAAVVAALTLTQSAGAYFNTIIEGLGANTILIQNGSSNNRGAVVRRGTRSLTVRDVQAIEKLPHVIAITPYVGTGAQVVYGNQNWKTNIAGVSSSFLTIRGYEVAQGVWFTNTDDAGAQPVAVLGDTVARNLFPSGVSPIGKQIRILGQLCRVIGVLSPKGGFGQDDLVFVPFNTGFSRLGLGGKGGEIDGVQLQVDTSERVDITAQAITTLLEKNHHIRAGQADDFEMITSDQLLQQVQQTTAVITILLVGVAAISLTVGGIGIMNIMLVSVTQRRREIGIRMAVGARRRDIRNQFLVESVVLCLLGGGLGLLGGLLIGYSMATLFGFPAIITAVTLIMPFAVSTGIALVFGIYPATRAARLDPVVALRSAK